MLYYVYMTYIDKLKKIQAVTGKNQTELAEFFGVSFPTINSWLNQKSTPRQKAQEKIDTAYQEYTGFSVINESDISQKGEKIQRLRTQIPNPLKTIISRKDLYDTYVLELTYHTNSIEGSTLNEPEVKAVIFDNATIVGKTVTEHQEAKNHQAALGYLFRITGEEKRNIVEDDIKKLHTILMNGILANAGQYRDHPVRIVGSKVVTANYLKVPILMHNFIDELNKNPQDIIAHIAATHAHFEQIHPFSDGNGRIGRLLMHFIALRNNLPPVLIKREKKLAYYSYLQRAQTENNVAFLQSFISDGVLDSYALLQ